MRKRSVGLLAASLVASLLAVSAARATVHNYVVNLDGPSEFSPNASPGIGAGTVSYDDVAHTLGLNVTFSGLTGTTTASHIHAPTAISGLGNSTQASAAMNAGVATTTPTFSGFPLGVTSGVYANVLNLTLASSYNPSYVTANGGTTASAEAALFAAISAGKAYWNIHSSTFGGGEIRGFLTPVPEPATFALGGFALLGLAALRRRRA